MSGTTAKSAALQRLQTVIGTVVIVAFWRRFIRHRLSPEELSLASRWSARKLKSVLSALPPSPFGSAASMADSDSPRSLSRTWSPSRLGRFFASFRNRSPLTPTAHASESFEGINPSDAWLSMTERPRFSTWREFHEDSLHHPAWGYYTDGRVAFGEEGGSADDFTTFPVSMRPAFGAMLADRIHSLWLASRGVGMRSGDADDRLPFLVTELGAGTGVLAHDILTHCESSLPQFYAQLTYVIGERSHALRAIQGETNARFVAEGKLRIVPADARDLHGSALRETLLEIASQARAHQGTHQGRTARAGAAAAAGAGASPPVHFLRGAVISNELPDAFGVERCLVGLCAQGGRRRRR